MGYEKGQSGNPNGRPRNQQPTAQKLRELIKTDDIKAIIAAMVEQAKGGDIQAAKLILDKVLPSLKAVEVSDDTRSNANHKNIVVHIVGRKPDPNQLDDE